MYTICDAWVRDSLAQDVNKCSPSDGRYYPILSVGEDSNWSAARVLSGKHGLGYSKLPPALSFAYEVLPPGRSLPGELPPFGGQPPPPPHLSYCHILISLSTLSLVIRVRRDCSTGWVSRSDPP